MGASRLPRALRITRHLRRHATATVRRRVLCTILRRNPAAITHRHHHSQAAITRRLRRLAGDTIRLSEADRSAYGRTLFAVNEQRET